MSGSHLLPPSWSSGASATSNDDDSTDVAASNLLKIQHSRKWRSGGLGTLQVTIDAGSAQSWDTVALLYHNGYTGTLRVTSHGSTGALFSAPDFDNGTVPLRFTGDLTAFTAYHTWVATGTTQTYRYVGLEISDGSNPDGYFEAGVVVVGEVFTPQIGAELGSRFGGTDPSEIIRLVNGEGIVRAKRLYGDTSWIFPYQPESDAYEFYKIHRLYGSKIPIVFKWDIIGGGSYEQYQVYYGYPKWRSGGPFTYTNGAGLYDVEVGIVEV